MPFSEIQSHTKLTHYFYVKELPSYRKYIQEAQRMLWAPKYVNTAKRNNQLKVRTMQCTYDELNAQKGFLKGFRIGIPTFIKLKMLDNLNASHSCDIKYNYISIILFQFPIFTKERHQPPES